MDQRVEPPSWLPDGAAGSDTKGLASDEPVADGTDDDGLESQGPVSFGSSSPGALSYEPASHDADSDDLAGESSSVPSFDSDTSGHDAAADVNPYSYATDTYTAGTSHPNGHDTAFGQETTPASGYGQETTPVGGYGQETTPASGYGQEAASAGGYGQGSTVAAGAVGAPVYPAAPFGDPAAPVEEAPETSRRAAVFSGISRPKVKTGAPRGRRADLVVARLEPWSVMKFSFLISLVAWVLLFVAVAVLYFALSTLGVFDSIQKTLESVTSSSGSSGVSLNKWFSASRILGYTMLIGAVNIVLITALSTVGSMIYNLVTHLGGGIEVTLRESD